MSDETMKAITWLDDGWHAGNPKALGPMTHGVWLGSVVFDGARAIRGLAPDLARHMARACVSARVLGLEPMLTPFEIEELAWEGIRRFGADAELYVCPMFWADSGFAIPDPASTRFALSVYEAPLPTSPGFTACLSSFRRPARDAAPTEAKASCLYPNISRIVREAGQKGFDTAAVLDPCGNLAEFAYTNLFLVKDGAAHTPAINGTFLNGITRQRVISLLRDAGVEVIERAITPGELLAAQEIFATGNYAKVQACLRYEDRSLSPGPVYELARQLYWDFAKRGA
ncbi:Branched-chain amino acid aminotransferase [Rhodospirillaceae bacterium LM-1]|nr:Branched-chain amino acid aminotransferase [Rhodospirillaceae bacterium LM-1]